ncbi:hypothetical protein MMC26_006347 [Xylographa opegraphella]|nr:hypothetical protein [Xylographa opegraphella]
MPSATASGADATGSAGSRNHNQGNQDRKYTVEQKTAVIRVRKCSATAFYEILGLEKTVSDAEIKKAYRKLSLLTHPDKNGYEGADEAFKMVSRAFQVLSDTDKKSKYDQFGGDPDNRFGSGAASASTPFSGFSRSASSGMRGPMFDDEISPEELFNRFFGGGLGGGGGGFGPFGGDIFGGGGSPFVFNLGGGPRYRVHQFGGGRPQRRPREANGTPEERQASATSILTNLLPLIILFVLPLLSSLFSGESTPSTPSFLFNAKHPYTMHRKTHSYKVDYFVNPNEVGGEFNGAKLRQLESRVEGHYAQKIRHECHEEVKTKNQMLYEAQGWIFRDVPKMQAALDFPMPNCQRCRQLQIPF